MELQRISDSIYLFKDTCNVYVVKRGNRCLTVGFGSGKILRSLPEIGVSGIDWVLHTHYHRDQCQGDYLLTSTNVGVPVFEVDKFKEVRKLWQEFTNFHKYSFTDFFILRESIPVATMLAPEHEFKWKDLVFMPIFTPGHTQGSISLITNIDSKRIVFTGDVISSPGKIWHFFDLQWDYEQASGLAPLKKSLDDLLEVDANVLLPSHGKVMDSPRYALEALKKVLARVPDQDHLYQSAFPEPSKGGQRRWVDFSPHIYYQDEEMGTSWLVLSDSGDALMYDCGNYWMDGITSKLKRIEAVIISHYHDDHVDGIPKLQQEWGCEVWAFENMVDILQHPARYHIPCLSDHSFHIDRVLTENEQLKWREYEFRVLHWPGHDQHHMGLSGEIDGKRVLFNGDGFSGIRCHNYYPLDGGSYVKSAQQLLSLNPEVIFFQHYGYLYPTRQQMLDCLEWAREMENFLSDVIAQPHPELGMDAHWITIYPYSVETLPGVSFRVEVRVRNHLLYLAQCQVELRAPAKWQTKPQRACFPIETKQNAAYPFCLALPPETMSGRYIITANVVFEGCDMGEFAEALVFVR